MYESIEKVILSKSIPDAELKAINGNIPEGAKVAFDLKAGVKGILTRASGYDAKPTTSLLSKAVVARLLRNMGATRESAKQALVKAYTDTQGATTQNLIDDDRELLLTIEEVDRDILDKLPKVRRAGAIKVAATVDFTKLKIEPQGL